MPVATFDRKKHDENLNVGRVSTTSLIEPRKLTPDTPVRSQRWVATVSSLLALPLGWLCRLYVSDGAVLYFTLLSANRGVKVTRVSSIYLDYGFCVAVSASAP